MSEPILPVGPEVLSQEECSVENNEESKTPVRAIRETKRKHMSPLTPVGKQIHGDGDNVGSAKKRRKSASGTPIHRVGSPLLKPSLTERQQMALLMQMTDPQKQGTLSGGEDSVNSTPRSDPSWTPRSRVQRRNERGETLLHTACIKGDLKSATTLIEQGADVNASDNAGWTPLHEACNYGHAQVVSLLLCHEADVNARGMEGDTPLHDAAVNEHLETVKLLLEYNSNPYQENDQGLTPVDVCKHKEILHLLTKGKISFDDEPKEDSEEEDVFISKEKRVRTQEPHFKVESKGSSWSSVDSFGEDNDGEKEKTSFQDGHGVQTTPVVGRGMYSREGTTPKSRPRSALYSDLSSSESENESSDHPSFRKGRYQLAKMVEAKQKLLGKLDELGEADDGHRETEGQESERQGKEGAIDSKTVGPSSPDLTGSSPLVSLPEKCLPPHLDDSISSSHQTTSSLLPDGQPEGDLEQATDFPMKSKDYECQDPCKESSDCVSSHDPAASTLPSSPPSLASPQENNESMTVESMEEEVPEHFKSTDNSSPSIHKTSTNDMISQSATPPKEVTPPKEAMPSPNEEEVPPTRLLRSAVRKLKKSGEREEEEERERLVVSWSLSLVRHTTPMKEVKDTADYNLDGLSVDGDDGSQSLARLDTDSVKPLSRLLLERHDSTSSLESRSSGSGMEGGDRSHAKHARKPQQVFSSRKIPEEMEKPLEDMPNSLNVSVDWGVLHSNQNISNGSLTNTSASTVVLSSGTIKKEDKEEVSATSTVISLPLIYSSHVDPLESVDPTHQNSTGDHRVTFPDKTSTEHQQRDLSPHRGEVLGITPSHKIKPRPLSMETVRTFLPDSEEGTLSKKERGGVDSSVQRTLSNGMRALQHNPDSSALPPKKRYRPVMKSAIIQHRQKCHTPDVPSPAHLSSFLMYSGEYCSKQQFQPTNPKLVYPPLPPAMYKLFSEQENERIRLTAAHLTEQDRMVLCMEQELLRAHQRSTKDHILLSVCSVLLEKLLLGSGGGIVYRSGLGGLNSANKLTSPSSEEVGPVDYRLLSGLVQDVWDKFQGLRFTLLSRQRHEAEALWLVQHVQWTERMDELGISSSHQLPRTHVPLTSASNYSTTHNI